MGDQIHMPEWFLDASTPVVSGLTSSNKGEGLSCGENKLGGETASVKNTEERLIPCQSLSGLHQSLFSQPWLLACQVFAWSALSLLPYSRLGWKMPAAPAFHYFHWSCSKTPFSVACGESRSCLPVFVCPHTLKHSLSVLVPDIEGSLLYKPVSKDS